jgi:hypothetical protein
MATSEVSIPDPALDKPPRARRWIPLSLRMFAAILGILGICACWDGFWRYRQYAARCEIQALGGSFFISLGGPDWLRYFIGNQWMQGFDRVTEVYLPRSTRPAEALSHIQHLPYVTLIDFRGTLANDSDLARLKELRLPLLIGIGLENTGITDAGIESLRAMPSLRGLNLSGTRITDSGLARLEQSHLAVLRVQNTAVSDIGLRSLKAIPELELVDLRGTRVSDAGVADLKRILPHLKIEK